VPAPRSAGVLTLRSALVACGIGAYAWGLYSGISRGWSDDGYFVAYTKCNASFDHCIESGPYRTLADCRHELVAINDNVATNDCIQLREVPRVYLPWTR
jgi:hypothetical protein